MLNSKCTCCSTSHPRVPCIFPLASYGILNIKALSGLSPESHTKTLTILRWRQFLAIQLQRHHKSIYQYSKTHLYKNELSRLQTIMNSTFFYIVWHIFLRPASFTYPQSNTDHSKANVLTKHVPQQPPGESGVGEGRGNQAVKGKKENPQNTSYCLNLLKEDVGV